MEKRKALLFVNLSILLFSTAGIISKCVDLPSLAITWGRVFFSSLTLGLFCLVTKTSLKIGNRKHLIVLLLSGILLAVHWWLFIESVQVSTVAIGTITFSSFPLFVTFLEPMLFHEKLRGRDVLAAVLVLLGVLVTVPEFNLSNTMSLGILLGMISALAYALLSLANRYFADRYPGTVVAFWEQFAAMVFLTPFFLKLKVQPSFSDLGLLLFLGIVTTALAHTLYIRSLQRLSARTAGIVSSLEAVYGIVLALLFLGEVPGLREILGCLIVVGVVIASQLLDPEGN